MVKLIKLRLRKQPTNRSFEQFMVDTEAKKCQAGSEIRDLSVNSSASTLDRNRPLSIVVTCTLTRHSWLIDGY